MKAFHDYGGTLYVNLGSNPLASTLGTYLQIELGGLRQIFTIGDSTVSLPAHRFLSKKEWKECKSKTFPKANLVQFGEDHEDFPLFQEVVSGLHILGATASKNVRKKIEVMLDDPNEDDDFYYDDYDPRHDDPL
ncbi:hypothetical protein KC929_03110 [Patescibacteria group bacterium]|nr:hypothetical protein [Patescibacteria group bacterium]